MVFDSDPFVLLEHITYKPYGSYLASVLGALAYLGNAIASPLENGRGRSPDCLLRSVIFSRYATNTEA